MPLGSVLLSGGICRAELSPQWSRPARSEDRGRVTGTVPAAVTTFVAIGTSLLKRLQDHEGDRVETYRELESVLWGDDGCLTSGVVNRLIAEALSDMRAAQGVTGDVKMAASDVLVALARSHFHFVMSELQSHLKAMRKVPDEIVLLTLGKMARRYALRCIPFVGMTLLALRAVLTQRERGGCEPAAIPNCSECVGGAGEGQEVSVGRTRQRCTEKLLGPFPWFLFPRFPLLWD
ncbi:maestro heat-like repeat-containing protein family member 2A [Morphnus guianensis]